MTETYELFTVPKGTKVSEVETDDPLKRRFEFQEPEGAMKTLELGPNGITVTETKMAPDATIDTIGIFETDARLPGGGFNSDSN